MDLQTLEAGINWVKKEKRKWKSDFSSSFYEELCSSRPAELDAHWWDSTVDLLSKWRAIRSRKPPNTKEAIYARGLERLPAMDKYYQSIHGTSGGEPSIGWLRWGDIAPLFEILCEIKNSRSAVFGSKLGHFMFPKAFIVIDNEATGAFPYEFIWSVLQLAWSEFKEKDQAKRMLAAEMGREVASVHPSFPFETKIAELWLIGYKHK